MTITHKDCTDCKGAGYLYNEKLHTEEECESCEGTGMLLVTETHEEYRLWNIVQDLQQRVKELEERSE